VLTRPSGPDLVLEGGEVPHLPREPAYADKRRLEAEAPSASE